MQQLFKAITNPKNPKILAIGKNYVKHVKEMGGEQPPKEPVIFTKPFSSLFLADNDISSIKLPSHNHEIHHEIELGFMIGKQGKNVKPEDWAQYVGGYFLALDFTDRDMQGHFKKQGFPWDLAKGQDEFLPISSFVNINQVADPHSLALELKINGNIVQQDSTGSMHFKIPDLLSYISQYMTLNIGDLILTGTPHGVGPVRSKDKLQGSLKTGELVLAELNLHIE